MSENHHSTLPHPTLRFGGVSNGYTTYTTLREDPERQPLLAQPPGSPSHMSYQKIAQRAQPAAGRRLGPLYRVDVPGAPVGGGTTIVAVTAAIYCFGPLTGGHMNPVMTMATFMVGMVSLPRAVLYIGAQLVGGGLAGLMLRASWGGSRDFKVGGCYIFDGGSMSSDGGVSASSGLPGPVAGADVGAAFAVEFAACLAFITLAYAAALDPRNRDVIGPRLPGAEGFGGASLNPARCFGVYVGSRFPGWHWVH
ncbi:hypothetical protein RB597_002693 [Gaeumannomyces tritici]